MSKRKMFIVIMFLILTCVFGGLIYRYYHCSYVPFEFHTTIAIVGNTSSPSGFVYADNTERLMFWLNDYREWSNLQPAIEDIDLSSYDFQKYDYLLFSGYKLESLYYSPWLTHKNDECYNYDRRIPLMSTLVSGSIDTMYIYRIRKTDRFRAPCP